MAHKNSRASYNSIEPSSPPPDDGKETELSEHPNDTGARVWTITLFTLTACLGSMLNGFVLGYSSATTSELDLTKPETGEHSLSSSSAYSSLFTALAPVGALVGGPVAGWMSDRFGRKIGIMVAGVPHTLGWLLISCANSAPSQGGFIALLELGRFLTGFATGWISLCVPVYVSEISTAKLKGLFGACQQLFVTLGIFFVELLGAIYSYRPDFKYYHVSLVALGLVVLFEALMLLTMETPRWLMAHSRAEEAKKVLQFLRGPACNIDQEMNGMTEALRKQPQLTLRQTLREFKHRAVYFPVLLALGLSFFQQMSGINASLFYTVTVFTEAQVSNPPLVASFAVGAVQVVFTLISVLLVDLTGRKVLLVLGSVVLSLSSVIIGVEFILSHFYCNSNSACRFSPMAIAGLTVYIMAFSIAWGAIPWLMMSELIPQRVRGISSGIVTALNWSLAAVVTGAFKPYSDAVRPWFAWWTFALFMAASIPFVLLLLPETKGHSLEEIEDMFKRRHGKKEQKALIESNSESVN